MLSAAAAATLATGLAACGSSAGRSSASSAASTTVPADPGVVLSRAYSQTVAAHTAAVTFSIRGQVAGNAIDVTGNGAFDWGARTGQLSFSFAIPGQAQPLMFEEVLSPTAIYAKFPAPVLQSLGVTTPWVQVPLATAGALSSGPDQTLTLLATQARNVTLVGPATVDGVATNHYRANVDPRKSSAALPAGLRATVEQLYATSKLTDVPVDVWIDADGRAVRIASTVTLQVPAGATDTTVAGSAAPTTAGATQAVTTTSQFDLSRYGTPVSAQPPAADQVSQSSQLNSIFGG